MPIKDQFIPRETCKLPYSGWANILYNYATFGRCICSLVYIGIWKSGLKQKIRC